MIKRIAQLLLALFLLVLAALIIIPNLYKSRLLQELQTAINSELNATLHFSDASLSLFHDFPNLSLEVEELSLTGTQEFAADTLFQTEKLSFTLSLTELLIRQNAQVEKIELLKPNLKAIVLENGQSNWEAMMEAGLSEPDTSSTSSGSGEFTLKQFLLHQAKISYTDHQSKLYFETAETDLSLQFHLKETIMDLLLDLSMKNLNLQASSMNLLSNATIDYSAGIEFDTEAFRFQFNENHAKINEFPLSLNGWIAMPNESIDMDLEVEIPSTEIKPLLSLLPPEFRADFNQIEAMGTLSFLLMAKGTYLDEQLPAFRAELKVANGFIQYPDLPQAINRLELDFVASNPGGTADQTHLNLKNLELLIGQNPLQARFTLTQALSDPNIDLYWNTNLQLEDFRSAMPLTNEVLEGNLTSEMEIRGKLSDWEQNRLENLYAQGSLSLKNFLFQTDELPHSIQIPQAEAELGTRNLIVRQALLQLGESDLEIQANLSNLMPWLLSAQATLYGNIDLKSNYWNADEWMSEDESATPSDTTAMSFVEVPQHIELTGNIKMDQVIYDQMTLGQVRGNLSIKDQRISVLPFELELFKAHVQLQGFYQSSASKQADLNMKFTIDGMEIEPAVKQFSNLGRLAPILAYTQGSIDAELQLTTEFDSLMNMNLDRTESSGLLRSNQLRIVQNNLFERLATISGREELREPELKNIQVRYRIENGNLFVEPVRWRILNRELEYSGNHYLAGTIDSRLLIPIPLNEAIGLLPELENNLPAEWLPTTNVPLYIHLEGPLNQPEFRFSLKESSKSGKEIIQNQVDKQIDKQKEALEKKAREILRKAEEQKKKVLEQADRAAKKLIQEADLQAEKLIREASNKSLLEKKLAEKAAQKIRDEARKKANDLKREANSQAEAIMNKAAKEVENLS